MTATWRRIGPVFALGVFLAACAVPAPYAPRLPGHSTGYTDRELAPGRWRITFAGNSVTPRDKVEDYLLLRAAEVTVAAGGTHFLFDSRDTQARTRTDVVPLGGGPGFYGYWGFHPRWGYDPLGPDVMVTQTTRYEAYAEIVVLQPGQDRGDPRAVDAQAIIDHLGPEGHPPPPPAPPPA